MVSGHWITGRTYSFLSSLLFLGCLSFHFFSSQFPTELTPAWGMAGPTPHSLLYSVSEKAEIVKEGNRYMKVHSCQSVVLNMSAKLENSAVATRLTRVVFIPNPNKDNAKECSVQFSSVTQLCLAFCHPMDCSTPGFPVHHQLLEFTQTHVH